MKTTDEVAWQQAWKDADVFASVDDVSKPKFTVWKCILTRLEKCTWVTFETIQLVTQSPVTSG